MFRRLTVVVGLSVVLACSSSSSSSTSEPGSQKTTTPEQSPGLVVHTDEVAGFEVSYPKEWSPLTEMMAAVTETEIRDFFEKAGASPPPAPLFAAGLPFGTGVSPAHFILEVQAGPEDMTSESSADATVAFYSGPDSFIPSFALHGRKTIDVGGRETVVIESSYDFADLGLGEDGRFRFYSAFTAVDGFQWGINCGTSSESSKLTEELEACDAVIRSFRLLDE